MDNNSAEFQSPPKKNNTLLIVFGILGGIAVLFVVGIVILSVLAGLSLPVLSRARESARRVASASNLSQMGKALILYADGEGKGTGPSDPKKLYPKYINDYRVFKRQGYPENQDVHYMLVVGTNSTDSEEIAAFENPPSNMQKTGRNVLHMNGSVEWLPDNEFQAALKKTEKTLTDDQRTFKIVQISRAAFQQAR